MAADSYDYIIVGAGSAGCVLAHRLSEDADARVLLIEAGGPDRDPLIHIPVGIGKIGLGRSAGKPKHDWGYETEPEPHLGGRTIETRRGKVLGGSSSINVMAYVRGHPRDYDRWAAMGLAGWSFAELLPYFKRCETFETGTDAWRGGSGPLGTSFAKTPDPLFPALIAAGVAAGYKATADYNGAEPEGFGRSQMTIAGGRRASAAVAFLRPALQRRNLTLVSRALVTRVRLSGTRAVAIDYLGAHGPAQALAEREVILAGGVFNSPQLLMLSGIGPADHLHAHGIAPLIDLPGVGGNLQDHPAISLRWARRTPGPFHGEMRADRMLVNLLRAHFLRSGPATYLPGGTFAFIRTDPARDRPDIQFLFPAAPAEAHLWFPGVIAPYRDGFGARPCLLHPASRGTVRLRSSDPRDPPRITQNFLAEPEDLARLRTAVRLARDIVGQAPLDDYREAELAPGPECRSDAEIDGWIRKTLTTASHPSCSCAMGTGETAVLDAQCRVRGIDGLRVVDASSMPEVPSGNINAAVLMLAEKASDMIRGRPALAPEQPTGAVPRENVHVNAM